MLLGKFPVFSVVLPQFCCLTGVMKRKTDKDDYGLQTEFERIVRAIDSFIRQVEEMEEERDRPNPPER